MKKRHSIAILAVITMLVGAGQASAVPVMQVGVSDGSGGYLPYTATSAGPTESDTAITNGSEIVVGGLVGSGETLGVATDWSSFKAGSPPVSLPASFDGHGALMVVSVADGLGLNAFNSLMLNGNHAFTWDADNSYFPTNHDPVHANVSDFLFFDIGSFTSNPDAVPNFADAADTSKDGEIKAFTISGMGNLEWAHFDVMAIKETANGREVVANNPGSHDATAKQVPEPATMLLLGTGLTGLAAVRRRKNA